MAGAAEDSFSSKFDGWFAVFSFLITFESSANFDVVCDIRKRYVFIWAELLKK